MNSSASDSWPALQDDAKWTASQTLASLVVVVIGLLISLGALLVARRLGGAFSADLPRGMLLLTAVVAVAIAGSARSFWRQLFPLQLDNAYSFSWSDLFVGWGSSCAIVLIVLGCSFPGDRLSDWLIWLPLLVIDLFWRQFFFDGGHPELQAGLAIIEQSLSKVNSPDGTSENGLTAQDCTQQIFRVREPDGQEAIYATLQAEFQSGQRYATAYVGFCPPLPYRPTIEVDPSGGPAAEVKVVQALSHGARLDLKLATAAQSPTHVEINLAARCLNSSDS